MPICNNHRGSPNPPSQNQLETLLFSATSIKPYLGNPTIRTLFHPKHVGSGRIGPEAHFRKPAHITVIENVLLDELSVIDQIVCHHLDLFPLNQQQYLVLALLRHQYSGMKPFGTIICGGRYQMQLKCHFHRPTNTKVHQL